MNFTVDTEQVRTTAGQVNSAASEISGQLHSLRSQIESLQGDWQGPASTALQDLFGQWDRDAQDLNTTLEEIAQQMNSAAEAYDTNEANERSRFAQS